MGKYWHTIYVDGGAISNTTEVFTSPRRLVGLLTHVNTAPTTSENLVITLDSANGPAFDTVLYTLDLSTASTTDIAKTDFNLPLQVGDALKTTYSNSDGGVIGVVLVLE